MLYFQVVWVARDGYDIKAHRQVDTIIFHVSISSLHYLIDFAICYRFKSIAIAFASTCFHFDYGKYSIFLCDDIQLFMPKSPVSITYSIATRHQIGHSTIFTYTSILIMSCHPCFFCKYSIFQLTIHAHVVESPFTKR